MTPTDTLRAASAKLREMAEAATPGPWFLATHRETHPRIWGHEGDGMAEPVTESCASYANAALIATLGPTFAALVADMLDREADVWQEATERLPADVVAGVLAAPSCVTFTTLARHVLGEEG